MSQGPVQIGQATSQLEINITPDILFEIATIMREKTKVCYPGEKISVPVITRGRQIVFRYDPQITSTDISLRPRAALPGTQLLARNETAIQELANRDDHSH